MFRWPKWYAEATRFIENCEECKNSDRNKMIPQTPLVPVVLPMRPWEKVAIDIKGPLEGGPSKYLLVIVDYYSKWPEVIPITKISSESIIKSLRQVFVRFGLPKEIVSDNGTQLVSEEFEKFLERLSINHRKVALYATRQNGLVERFNRVIAEKLAEAKKFKWNKQETIDEMLFQYRGTPHSITGISPYEAMFGRHMRDLVSRFAPDLDRGERI